MTELIQIITTTDSDTEAYQIAQTVLEAKLAACVTVSGPVKSIYWWQGKLDQATEWQCTIKTRADWYEKVRDLISSVHSYEIPEITAIPILEVNEEYLNWVAETLEEE